MSGFLRDPVCGKKINRAKAHIALEYKGETYYLCCPLCQSEFERDPDRYIASLQRDRGGGRNRVN